MKAKSKESNIKSPLLSLSLQGYRKFKCKLSNESSATAGFPQEQTTRWCFNLNPSMFHLSLHMECSSKLFGTTAADEEKGVTLVQIWANRLHLSPHISVPTRSNHTSTITFHFLTGHKEGISSPSRIVNIENLNSLIMLWTLMESIVQMWLLVA